MSDHTLYAVCNKTKHILLSIVSDEMDNTIPIESKIEVAAKRMSELQKNTSDELGIAKVQIKVTEVL